MRGEPAVVVEDVEGDRGRAGLPDPRERLGVQRDGRRDASADEERPARRTSTRTGCARARPGSRRGAGASRAPRRGARARAAGSGPSGETPISTGGWWRQTYAGRSSSASRSSSQASDASVSSPGSTRSPGRRGHQRVEHQEPGGRQVEHLVERAVRLAVEEPAGERVADVVVAGPDQQRTGPAGQDRARRGVLLGVAVVGDVAGHQEQVGARVEGQEVVEDPVARGRARRAARRGAGR